MNGDQGFLSVLRARPWTPKSGHDLRPAGLFIGEGTHGIEIAVAHASTIPASGVVGEIWKHRRGGRAAPVLIVLLSPDETVLCGPAGEQPPVYRKTDRGQAERMCLEVLAQPDRHAALRYLAQALPSLRTPIFGLANEGLLAVNELRRGTPCRSDWQEAGARAQRVAGKRDRDLLTALGYRIESIDNLTSLLRSRDQRVALAVLLRESESPEAGAERFNHLSPVSYALAKADTENLPWVVMIQGSRLRLYSKSVDAGVGRRGRSETYVECQPALLSDEHLPYLWLIFSADALSPGGSLGDILEDSQRFAGDLAKSLRERIYEEVMPELAQGIAAAQPLQETGPENLSQTYEMALTVLFRLLFVAYAEDRDLLPYRSNDAYRHRSLKQKALELAESVANDKAIGTGSYHWKETALLWSAVAYGNSEWSVPAYNGGLFSDDPAVSHAGAALAEVELPDLVFEKALRALLVTEVDGGEPGPVDFRSLSVREFGTIYEGLLESELAIAETDLAVDAKGNYLPAGKNAAVAVGKGSIYLHNRSGQRKASGSYYTKHFAVEHLLDGALEPALRDHFERLSALDAADAAEQFFDFRVTDIAMGSGHFLIAAIDRIEKGMADYLTRRPLPGVRAELTVLRDAAMAALDELADATVIEDGQLLRRMIARRCIYGVDLNALSVQLARLSVWIHTFVPGLPLSVLDHSLVHGNALVGVGTVDDIWNQLRAATDDAPLLTMSVDDLIGEAARPLNRLAKINDATLRDVERAREAIREASDAILPTRELCDFVAALPLSGDVNLDDLEEHGGRGFVQAGRTDALSSPPGRNLEISIRFISLWLFPKCSCGREQGLMSLSATRRGRRPLSRLMRSGRGTFRVCVHCPKGSKSQKRPDSERAVRTSSRCLSPRRRRWIGFERFLLVVPIPEWEPVTRTFTRRSVGVSGIWSPKMAGVSAWCCPAALWLRRGRHRSERQCLATRQQSMSRCCSIRLAGCLTKQSIDTRLVWPASPEASPMVPRSTSVARTGPLTPSRQVWRPRRPGFGMRTSRLGTTLPHCRCSRRSGRCPCLLR